MSGLEKRGGSRLGAWASQQGTVIPGREPRGREAK